jgi:ADP-ribosylglycohydrolase
LISRAAESSYPTHRHRRCITACVYQALLLCGLIHGLPREEVLRPDWEPLQHARELLEKGQLALHPDIATVAEGSFRMKQPPAIAGGGFVVECLEAALWAFHDAPDFRTAVLRAVNLGDDADTTGAVCGQLAGAYWGETGTPAEWRAALARRDMIEQALTGLLK